MDLNGELDFHEFVRWVAMWSPPDDDADCTASWRRGGPTDQRVWARAGDGFGRVGRVDRLMGMIDADHDGAIECFEFLRALARKDDYDRPVGGGGLAGGLGQGRLNPDGSVKEAPKAEEPPPPDAPPPDTPPDPAADIAAAAAWLAALTAALRSGGFEPSRRFAGAIDQNAVAASARIMHRLGSTSDRCQNVHATSPRRSPPTASRR